MSAAEDLSVTFSVSGALAGEDQARNHGVPSRLLVFGRSRPKTQHESSEPTIGIGTDPTVTFY